MKKIPSPISKKILADSQTLKKETPPFLRICPGGVMLTVKVQPRASQNGIEGPLGDALKVRVTAPPVDAAANEALIVLLSEEFECARSTLSIVRGHTSRIKQILFRGMDLQSFQACLQKKCPSSQ